MANGFLGQNGGDAFKLACMGSTASPCCEFKFPAKYDYTQTIDIVIVDLVELIIH